MQQPIARICAWLALGAFLVSGCTTERDGRTGRLPQSTRQPSGPLVTTSGSSSACTLPPGGTAASTPPGFAFRLRLPPGSVLTRGALGASESLDGHAPGTVAEVTAALRTAIGDAGYIESSFDNEGRSTKIDFFTGARSATATVSVSPCSAHRVPFSLVAR
jgi:hypothetical protein